MKKLFTTIALFCFFNATAQNTADVPEDKPVTINGIDYSYAIRNERNEDTYSRYEIAIMAQNKSGCPLIYLKNKTSSMSFDEDPSAIARFDCLNATGKRLTSKGGNLRAKPFYVPYALTEKTADGKTTTTDVKVEVGYLLKNEASVSNTFIVIVPKGERPKFKVRVQSFSELSN